MARTIRQITGKTAAEIKAAQDQLVNVTVDLALEELYAYAKSKKMIIENPSVVLEPRANPLDLHAADKQKIPLLNNDHKPCTTADETMQAILRTCDNEFERVLAYNQLAAAYGFDLSIKTSGSKKIGSIIAKDMRDQGKADKGSDADIIRVMATSSDLELLNTFEKKHSMAVNKLNNSFGSIDNYQNEKGWKLTLRGHLQRGIYKKLNGVGSELMLVPREQADIAARISHKYFEVTRGWETYQQDNEPTARKRQNVIKDYNAMAEMLNQLGSGEALPQSTMHSFNKVIRTADTSVVTFDNVSEGGAHLDPHAETIAAKDVTGHQPYSPVISRYRDLADYASFLYDVKTTPMPILAPDASDKEITQGMKRLDYAAQATHVCFMRHASPEWRLLWAACAEKLNKTVGSTEIHPTMIESMKEGFSGPKIADEDVQDKLHALEKKGKANGR